MLKKLLSITAIGVGVFGASALTPGFESSSVSAFVKATREGANPVAQTVVSGGKKVDGEALNREAQQNVLSQARTASSSRLIDFKYEEPKLPEVLSEVLGTAIAGSVETPLKAQSATPSRVVKFEEGSFIAKDLNYQGNMYTAPMSIEPLNDESGAVVPNTYELYNVYGTGSTIQMTIDGNTGAVEIPSQLVMEHATYGEVKICPITITDTGVVFDDRNPVTGTVDENGVINLNSWGIIITEEGANRGRAFNFMYSSEWHLANGYVSATSLSTGLDVVTPTYIEQSGPNTATFYCLSGITTDILTARLTPSKEVVVSPQQIYSNMYYGPFYIYACNWENNGKPDVTRNLTFTLNNSGALVSDGWAIAAKAAPTMYVGYIYKDITINGDFDLSFPEKVEANFEGDGTQASPYLIKTVADLQTLSQSVADGNTYTGKYLRLVSNLTMSSLGQSEYVPVGDYNNQFDGNFDGNENSIFGFTLNNQGFGYAGIFGYLGVNATVSNLNVYGARIVTSGDNLGIIAGFSDGRIVNCNAQGAIQSAGLLAGGIAGASTGSITGCTFMGSVTSTATAAGIVGQAYGEISNCNVYANVTINGYVSSTARECAGIVGMLARGKVSNCFSTGTLTDSYGMGVVAGLVGRLSGSEIEGSYSTMALSAKRLTSADDNYTGGLVGYTSDSRITDCFFGGTIIKTTASEYVGGLAGYIGVGYSTSTSGTSMINKTIFTNCYSSGTIVSTSSNAKKGLYGDTFLLSSWTGAHPEDECFVNCYYDKQINYFGEDKYGRDTQFFTSGVEGFKSGAWTSEAGRYPVLTRFKSEPSSVLASAPLLLGNQDASKVKGSFNLTLDPALTWASSDGAVTISGNAVTVGSSYANSVLTVTSTDNWALKLYRLAVVPKVFEGEGTADNPYLIKTPADFQQLNSAVAEYAQGHEGDYFVMPNDIDFAGNTDFHGVGFGTNYSFDGIFDGQGHAIHNWNQSTVVIEDGKVSTSSTPYSSLFGITGSASVVRNLTMADDNTFNVYSYAGAFIGSNNGLAENLVNHARINGYGSYVGAIAGLNNGLISNCYNDADVTGAYTATGGIAGANNPTGSIELSQNDGIVRGAAIEGINATTAQNTVGGIVGNNLGNVDRCVNNAYVSATTVVGGIAGLNSTAYGAGNVTRSINNAYTEATTPCITRGAIVGENRATSVAADFSGNYYDNAINVNGSVGNNDVTGTTGLASAQLTAATSLAGLDEADFDFQAGNYPVLKAFKDMDAAKTLRSIYIGFAEGAKRTNVQNSVSLSQADGLTWEATESANFVIDGSTLKVTVPAGMDVASATVTAKAGADYSKVFNLNSLPVIFKGEGTTENPYLIETPADWNKLADFMEASSWEFAGDNFRIENDLDFAGDSIRLVAVNGVNFQATLDGNGKTIKNYVYANPNSVKTKLVGPNCYVGKNIGLIGTLGNFGVVKNFTADGNFTAVGLIGGIVGECYGRIEGVTHKGTIANTSGASVAGIAYRMWEGSSIVDCVNEGSVTAKTTTATGIVCETKLNTLIDGCYNRGTVASTTTGACGIAYNVYGTVRNCGNEGTFAGTGSAMGICYTLYPQASLENCYNKADVDYVNGVAKAGGTICGLFYQANSRTDADAEFGGYIRNCYNTGNLTGTANVYGMGYKVNAGWTVENCYNEGDIRALPASGTGLACGLLNTIGESSKGSPTLRADLIDCYNAGDVEGTGAGVSGLVYSQYYYSNVLRCYNAGDIVNNSTTALTTAGLVSQARGQIRESYNIGNITAENNAIGGLVGYLAGGKADFPSIIANSFNVGNVVSNYTGTNTNGNAGGLVGYIADTNSDMSWVASIENCFNAGTVVATKRVAGLCAGQFRPYQYIKDSYNSGRVICLEPDAQGRYYWSGTTFTNSYSMVVSGDTLVMLQNHKNVYYDATVNPGSEFRTVSGSRKTTEELKELAISEAFKASAHGGYPELVAFGDDHSHHTVASAMLLIQGTKQDFVNGIGDPITLVGPAGAEWTVFELGTNTDENDVVTSALLPTQAVVIEDNVAMVRAKADNVVLQCSKDGAVKTFVLNVDPEKSEVSDLDVTGKTVERVTYIDLQGRMVAYPAPGQVYIVRTDYTDGTHTVTKLVARD